MPLTLVTGPANAAKAGWVLDAFREALERAVSGGRLAPPEPLLVVPTAADVEPYQRELAASGAVFGGEVVTFRGLLREVAARAGYAERALGPVARERVVAAAVRDSRLSALAPSAATPGFTAAAGRLFAELRRGLVTPARLRAAMRDWGGSAYGDELAALYSAYVARLDRLGRVDAEGWEWGALRALRERPAAWGGRPVFLYGFDDLAPAQIEAVEALSGVVGAAVVVSLPHEPGRAAFAGRAGIAELLRPSAERVVELPDRSEHYADTSRAALHHLERGLFEEPGEPADPAGAVRLLEAGGERAEAELVAAALVEMLRGGVAASDVAVLVRTAEEGPVIEQVLQAYGVPVVRSGPTTVARTRLGAGLMAYARAATPTGTAADLLTWLRTPGKAPAHLADELEARVRRAAASTAAQARALWTGPDLVELDALAAAAGAGAADFLGVLEAELETMWTAPWRRSGEVLGPEGAADARVAAEVRAACGELRSLAAADPALAADPAELVEALGSVRVSMDAAQAPASGAVVLADPLAVRARRFRVVAVCGLQDGAFPRRPVPEPFLDDDDRRALAQATGLALPLHEEVLDRERYLFYSAVSRAEDVLLLSYRSSDEEGEPQVPSPFLADVRALFTDDLWEGRGRRLLAEVTWGPADAPTPLELRRSQAARSPVPEPGSLPAPISEAVLAALAGRDCEPARGLESFAACGVRWMVESVLRPRRLDPDPEPMQRGGLAHRVLERTLAGLRERTGSARLAPERSGEAQRELSAAIAEVAATRAGARARAALRALEADLRRWLELECAADTGMEPQLLEWSFGGGGEGDPPALDLGGGVRISGRVDRVDVGPGGVALVRDYKNSVGAPAAKWAEEGRLQAALYALAVRDALGLEPVGAVYQPLSGPDLRARGAVREGAVDAGPFVGTDVLDADAFEALLDELRDIASRSFADLRAGRIAPCPERCTPRGCAYPGICRAREVPA
jgi:ATP-dependent helicase/DNAse subunit B